jgi:hypothetical protein
LGTINDASPAFTVHVGDILEQGKVKCSDSYQKRIREDFRIIDGVLLYTPGDNEWTDCGAGEELAQLKGLRDVFFSGGISLGKKPANETAVRQSREMPSFAEFPENMRMKVQDTIVVTVHIPGSLNGTEGDHGSGDYKREYDQEFKRRAAASAAWIENAFAHATRPREGAKAIVFFWQADFRYDEYLTSPTHVYDSAKLAVETGAKVFNGDVLIVHGDSHTYRCSEFLGVDGKSVKTANGSLIQRYVVPGADNFGAIRVRVDSDGQSKGLDVFTPRPLDPALGECRKEPGP